MEQTTMTIFFTGLKLIVLDILRKGTKFNQRDFVDYIFPDLKRESVNFHRRILQATFWVHMDNSLCRNGKKVASKFEKHHVSRLPHPPYSPDVSPSGWWLFGMLKRVLEDREFKSSHEIEKAIAKV
jgi:transposase